MINNLWFIDDLFEDEQYKKVIEYCFNAPYYFGEYDREDTLPTGMVSEISEDCEVYKLFESKIKEKVNAVKDLNLYRMYINCFFPGENPYFHTDGETGITCLFYVNPQVNADDGGSTQFLIGTDSINFLPIPNRLGVFDAKIMHRATSFRNKHRFTVAIKYK